MELLVESETRSFEQFLGALHDGLALLAAAELALTETADSAASLLLRIVTLVAVSGVVHPGGRLRNTQKRVVDSALVVLLTLLIVVDSLVLAGAVDDVQELPQRLSSCHRLVVTLVIDLLLLVHSCHYGLIDGLVREECTEVARPVVLLRGLLGGIGRMIDRCGRVRRWHPLSGRCSVGDFSAGPAARYELLEAALARHILRPLRRLDAHVVASGHYYRRTGVNVLANMRVASNIPLFRLVEALRFLQSRHVTIHGQVVHLVVARVDDYGRLLALFGCHKELA